MFRHSCIHQNKALAVVLAVFWTLLNVHQSFGLSQALPQAAATAVLRPHISRAAHSAPLMACRVCPMCHTAPKCCCKAARTPSQRMIIAAACGGTPQSLLAKTVVNPAVLPQGLLVAHRAVPMKRYAALIELPHSTPTDPLEFPPRPF